MISKQKEQKDGKDVMIEISPFMFGVIMIEDGMSSGIIKCLPSSTLHHSQQFPLDLSIELMPQLNKNDDRLKIRKLLAKPVRALRPINLSRSHRKEKSVVKGYPRYPKSQMEKQS